MSDHSVRGSIDILTSTLVEGWACISDPDRDDPLDLELVVDDLPVMTTSTTLVRQDVRDKGLHPTGRCGFRFTMAGGASIPDGSRIVVREKTTGKGIGQPKQLTGGEVDSRPRNHRGEVLTINKNGDLSVKFRDRLPDWEKKLLRAMKVMEGIFSEEFRLPVSLAYGTLLGVVRDNNFIPHDDDVDLFYLSQCSNVSEIAEESWRICEQLTRRGFRVQRFSHGQFLVFVPVEGQQVGVEFFSAWTHANSFYLNFTIAGNVAADQVLPLGKVNFKGEEFSVPANPPALLEAIYGPGWSQPDPAFKWKIPEEIRAALRQLDAPLLEHAAFWDRYHSKADRSRPPSQFAAFCAAQLDPQCGVIDLGCGDGRDSAFLASYAAHVIGADYSATAILANGHYFSQRKKLQFVIGNAYDRYSLGALAEMATAQFGDRRRCVYSRFLLNASRATGQENLLNFVGRFLRSGDQIMLEFGVAEGDESVSPLPSGAYERPIVLADLQEELGRANFVMDYIISGRGYAKTTTADPTVARLIATKS